MELSELLKKYNWILVIIVLVSIFQLMNPLLFKNTFVHHAPQGYHAQDAYWHSAYIRHIEETGYYTKEPPFTTGYSGFDVTPVEPPIFFYASVVLGSLLGIPHYDVPALLLFLLVVIAVLALYTATNAIDPLAVYGALPVAILLGTFPFIAGISWGFWKVYFASLLLFAILVLFFFSDRSWKSFALFGLCYASLFASHASAAMHFSWFIFLMYCYDIYLNKSYRTTTHFLKYASIVGVAALLSINYIFDFYAGRVGTEGFFAVATGTGGYPGLFGANAYVHHLGSLFGFSGLFFWLAFLGILTTILFLKLKEKMPYLVGSALFFIVLLGPILGYNRIYQFRLVWPLYIAIFVGLLLVFLLRIAPLNSALKAGVSVMVSIVFILLIIPTSVLFATQVPQQSMSVFEDSFWEGVETLRSLPDGKVLFIDPSLSQRAIVYQFGKYTKFISAKDVARNETIANYGQLLCTLPSVMRTGFASFESFEFTDICPNPDLELCEYKYFLLHNRIQSAEQRDWLVRESALLNALNASAIWQKEQTVIIENLQVCE